MSKALILNEDLFTPRFEFKNSSEFTIHQYNCAKPFTNFLPGVAGLWGIPMWAFFVNRGQGIACFGIKDKDHAMMEFQSANLHFRRVSIDGFRTFIKIVNKGYNVFYEPFRYNNPSFRNRNKLIQTDSDLSFEEFNETLDLRIKVNYFTIPNENFPGLARSVTITNDSSRDLDLEILDGFASVVPYGISNFLLKSMPFITDGYLVVKNLDKHIPYFTIGNVPGDESETSFVKEGNFCFSFTDTKTLPIVVDPALIFGDYNDRVEPYKFFKNNLFSIPENQNSVCQTPCAFSFSNSKLTPGQAITIYSLYSTANSTEQTEIIADKIRQKGYFKNKQQENKTEIAKLKHVFRIQSGDPLLDAYTGQCFLDNVLRGGLPITITTPHKKQVLNVYSRKHGDLERDYNFFQLEPLFYSQGNGNFRDVNQNRRNDVWFNTDVSHNSIHFFFSLIQADGFNPLLLEGSVFELQSEKIEHVISLSKLSENDIDLIKNYFQNQFTIGSMFEFFQNNNIFQNTDKHKILQTIIDHADRYEKVSYGHGYWSDHWMYSFDILERFGDLFPDLIQEILIRDKSYTFWDTDVKVLPRYDKYVLNHNNQVRHLHSVDILLSKSELIRSRKQNKNCLRVNKGQGEIYYTNLLGKIFCLLVNKLATISPSGIGIEMDGGRPGWCDSVNGIPSLFAAGTPEVSKLHYVISLLQNYLNSTTNFVQYLPEELYEFYQSITMSISEYLCTTEPNRDFYYWKSTSSAKELYRTKTEFGFTGNEKTLTSKEILKFLEIAKERLNESIKISIRPEDGLITTYVTHEAKSYRKLYNPDGTLKLNKEKLVCVEITEFESHFFAPFLEGIVYKMAITNDTSTCKDIYHKVKASPLYDSALKMYKINYGLDKESPEQGRTGGWAKGWFENESIFSHVEYKYLLQLLRSGLYEEFFTDMYTCLPPYLKPAIYGRSPIENVSFIVCSAHQRKEYHGRGMQPRLSGTNAEFIHIMLLLSFGEKPFTIINNELTCSFNPILTSELFTKKDTLLPMISLDNKESEYFIPKNSFAALFLGKTLIIYRNDSRKNTFGESAVKPVAWKLIGYDNSAVQISSAFVKNDEAKKVRDGFYKTIEITLE